MCVTLGIGMGTGVPNRASMVGATGLSGAEATTEQSPTSVPRIGDAELRPKLATGGWDGGRGGERR